MSMTTHHCIHTFTSAVLVVCALATAPVHGGSHSLEGIGLTILVNNEDPIVAVGADALTGQYVDPLGRWTITWNYVVKTDPSVSGVVSGNATFKNSSGSTVVFDMILEAPVCPVVIEESLVSGTLSLKVFVGADGAQLYSVGESPVYAALTDENVSGQIFAAPFAFGGSGGVVTTNGAFGKSYPLPAGPIHEAAAHRIRFSMTNGNTAEFTTAYTFSADSDNIADCPDDWLIGDLNGDGKVNVNDLILLIVAWGPCAGCLADLTGDGVVGVADLAVLMANWTS